MSAVLQPAWTPRVALYARYSSDQQRSASVDAEGWRISEMSDEAMSGAGSNCPRYEAVLAAASNRDIDALVIDDLSRLSRDQVESERVIRRLEFLGIRIIAVTDGYGYGLKPILDPSNKDAYGNPARVGTVLEIDEAQAKIVAEIFDAYARGLSYFTIARALNERGVPSPGSTWKTRGIQEYSIGVADGVLFQEEELRLFASLPS